MVRLALMRTLPFATFDAVAGRVSFVAVGHVSGTSTTLPTLKIND